MRFKLIGIGVLLLALLMAAPAYAQSHTETVVLPVEGMI